MEESMRYSGEIKGWTGHVFHHTIDRIMRPLIISMAMYFGMNISMSDVFTTLWCIDWLHWPIHMLPGFMDNIRRTKRQMKRMQSFFLLDEV